MDNTVYTSIEANGCVFKYMFIDAKDQKAPILPEYIDIRCHVCDKSYKDFYRDERFGTPVYYRENWEETRNVKKRKIKYFYCGPVCSNEDHKRNPIHLAKN